MEYVYAALLLHNAKKEVNEANIKKVAEAAGIPVEDAKVKALIASLDGVNIDEAMTKAATVATAPAPAAEAAPAEGKKPEKDEKSEEKKEEEAAGGLAALFG